MSAARHTAPSPPIRVPGADDIARARITHFQSWLRDRHGREFADYDDLWRWSVADLDGFWDAVREYFAIPLHGEWTCVLADSSMPGAQWFPGARLNYVEQIFRHRTSQRPAIVAGREDGTIREIGWDELERDVGAFAAWLRASGVQPGDRIVAYLPNVPETIVAFLATASVGAVWSVCSPDMGAASVLDRFRQIEPRVLITIDGYVNGGRRFDRSAEVTQLLAALQTVEHVVWLPILGLEPPEPPTTRPDAVGAAAPVRAISPRVTPSPHVTPWSMALSEPASVDPMPVPFDHPLWIVYSSGTTGLPKAIVHGHGGIVLEHVKAAALHFDLGHDDRFFWFSSTGWIMWNLQIAGLLVGTTICIFDGSPAGADAAAPDLDTLWRFAACGGATFFGAGAAFYASCAKADLAPGRANDLSRIRGVGSTGSPLSTESERWIYRAVGLRTWVAPVSGGTDFASGFVGGAPVVASYLGEMQVRCLGARVEAWNEAGESLIDAVGELVCTAPMPSMPLRFWNDPGHRRYLDSYFDMFPGVWRHGDWIRITPHAGAHGAVIYGRSDATINRHGIRMGTAEFYRAVERLPEVLDSLVVDLEYLGRESYLALFVTLQPGCKLDDALRARIVETLRAELSPRHVPTEIVAVADVPRTLTGKKLELPVKKLLLGQSPEKVLNRDAMANPACIEWYVEFARRYQERTRS